MEYQSAALCLQNSNNMVVQIHFTDAEIRQYLEKLGFVVEKRTFCRMRNAYHNRIEFDEVELDAVVMDGQKQEASVFFSNIIEKTVKQLVNNN